MNKIKIIFLSLFLAGCSASIIKVGVGNDSDPYRMFGRIPQRNFLTDEDVTDSVREKWEAEINGSFPLSSVTAYGDYVFTNDLSGRVFCFNLKNGKTLGQLKLKGSVYTAPVAERYWLIFAVAQRETGKSVLSYYDYTTGKSIHEITIDGLIMTELIKLDDGIIFSAENGLTAKYDFSGNHLWENKTNYFTHSSPAYDNGILFFGNDAGEIIGLDGIKGSVKYRVKIGGPFFSGAAISDGAAYIGNDDGNLYALEISNGKILWKYQTGSRIAMVPSVGEQEIFVGNLGGELLSINKKNGSLNWSKNLGGVLNSSILITKNKLIVPDLNEKVFIIEKETGEVRNSYNFDGRVKLSPVIHKNTLFIGYDNGILKAYEFY